MEKVVYILGAGFSAPLGLPLMGNFLEKAKDMFFLSPDRERFSHFKAVFDTIAEMSVAKNYYETDLSNIEEILSILEMRHNLAGTTAADFKKFICDVIDYYTPNLPHWPDFEEHSWDSQLFAGDWSGYGAFFANLLSLSFKAVDHHAQKVRVGYFPRDNSAAAYGVISLNYDLLFEKVAAHVKSLCSPCDIELHIDKKLTGEYNVFKRGTLGLAKLHGSTGTAGSAGIVAPTWNKNVNSELRPVWAAAHRMLAEANHLRIIGYSLPDSDAYVRYLLKSAVTSAPHLKSIDVICRDGANEVERRYKQFITFRKFRFRNGDTTRYLLHSALENLQRVGKKRELFEFNNLEAGHKRYMEQVS